MAKNKKGQIGNYISVITLLLVVSLCYFIAMLIVYYFNLQFLGSGVCAGTDQCPVVANGFVKGLAMFDYVIYILMVCLVIGVGLTSYKLPTNVAFVIISVITAPFLGFISYFFNFLFAQIVSQTMFDVVRAYFPRTLIVCTNFHWIALACFVVGTITLFAKRDSGLGVIE